jgi:phage portal protein BeeE
VPIFRRRETRGVLGAERRDPTAATIGTRSSSVGLAAAPEMSDDWALRQAYLANVFVHAAISAVADDLASLAFRVGPDPSTPQDYDVEHPLARLLGPPPGGPNPSTTARRLWRFTVAQFLLTGRFGWEKERSARGGEVVALWPLVSGRMKPVGTSGGASWFSGIEYDAGSGRNRTLRIEDVVYEWRPAPDDFRKPESALAAARLDVSVAVMQDRYDLAFLRNDARPSAVIVHEARS